MNQQSYVDNLGNVYVAPLVSRTTTLKATPVQIGTPIGLNVYGYNFYNQNTVDIFLKFYSKSVSPTINSDTVTITIQIPAQGSAVLMGNNVLFPLASKGWVACTTESTDTGTTAPTLDILSQVFYR